MACVVELSHYAEDLVLLVQVYLQVLVGDHHQMEYAHALIGEYPICGESFGCQQLFCERIMDCGHGDYELAKS